nr:recombinase family protein [Streptomyces sp. NBC_00899]
MTIVEDEAEVVREVFDRYLKGEGAAPLAKDLHRRGIRTAGGKAWSAGTVRGLRLPARRRRPHAPGRGGRPRHLARDHRRGSVGRGQGSA